jgi:aryl-alcohol dehydrogenase-like predicted oxidoreductase
MALDSKRAQFALLEAVVSAGITHFDTAPYYGYGAVEPLLGEFLKTHGVSATVTTKFGIQPPPRIARGNVIMSAARRIGRISPRLRGLMARGAATMVSHGSFEAATAERNLRDSLRNLGRERIDYYLLHEPTAADTERPGLQAFLETAVADGRIGRFGTGGEWRRVREVIALAPSFASVLQFDNAAPQDRVPLVQDPNRLIATFGCVGPAIKLLRQRRVIDFDRYATLLRQCGIDPMDEEALGAALLARAVARNPEGIVLFATHHLSRLQKSVRAVEAGEFTTTHFKVLDGLLAEDNDSRS